MKLLTSIEVFTKSKLHNKKLAKVIGGADTYTTQGGTRCWNVDKSSTGFVQFSSDTAYYDPCIKTLTYSGVLDVSKPGYLDCK